MKKITAQPIANNFDVGIVVSRFNDEITEQLLQGALERLKELGFQEDQITVAHVPGAVEVPIAVKRMAQTKQFDAVIALGCVIRGETAHFEYVSGQVSQGCQTVMLEENVPVIFGVLTTETQSQAKERVGGKRGHMGRESVEAAYEMVSVLRQISESVDVELYKKLHLKKQVTETL